MLEFKLTREAVPSDITQDEVPGRFEVHRAFSKRSTFTNQHLTSKSFSLPDPFPSSSSSNQQQEHGPQKKKEANPTTAFPA